MAMGTRMDAVLTAVDTATSRFVLAEMAAEVEALEDALSTYRPSSALSALNRHLVTNTEAVIDDSIVFDTLCYAEDMFQLTRGHFDCALGCFSEVYKKQRTCSAQDRARLSKLSGMQNVVIDRQEQRLSIAKPGLKFDFGGLGKGVALNKCRAILERLDVDNALLSFGDSAILALGSHPHGDHWPINIPHPLIPGESLKTVELRNQSLALSSNIKNQGASRVKPSVDLNPHIVNPLTGQPITRFKTTSVVTDNAAIGEALSTALLVVCTDNLAQAISPDVHFSATIFDFNDQGVCDEYNIGAL